MGGLPVTQAAKSAPSLKHRALRMLARREHAREELRRKLERLAVEGDNVDAVLDELAARGWVSDARFAEQAIRTRSRRFGPLKVAHQLRSKGVEAETIAAAFRAAGDDGIANLDEVWSRRFSSTPGNDRERARQIRFLQCRGFALDQIIRYLRDISA